MGLFVLPLLLRLVVGYRLCQEQAPQRWGPGWCVVQAVAGCGVAVGLRWVCGLCLRLVG